MANTKLQRAMRIAAIASMGSLTLSLLSGCIVEPIGPRPPPPGVYVGAGVAYAPPAAQAEYVGVAPYPGYIWSAGYWGWVGGRYTWVGGHWLRPVAGYRWEQPRWVRGPGGWRFAPGHWRR